MTTIFNNIPSDVVFKYITSENDIKRFLSDVILSGNNEIFNKYVIDPFIDLTQYFTPYDILSVIPITISPNILKHLLTTFTFENAIPFFYNYALYNDDVEIKSIVYDYFVENHSDVLFDNLKMYSKLVE